MENQHILLIVLVILLVITAFQAVQLSALVVKVSSGAVAPVSVATSTGSSSLPSSLQNLPNMVGGC